MKVVAGEGLSYVLPSQVFEGGGQVEVKFRLKAKVVKKSIVAKCGANILGKRFLLVHRGCHCALWARKFFFCKHSATVAAVACHNNLFPLIQNVLNTGADVIVTANN